MKKLLSIFLATLMLMSCLSITASAEETATPDYSAEEAILSEKMNYPTFELTKLGQIGEYDLFYDLSDMPSPWEPVVYIGDYKFICANSKFINNPGLYLVSDYMAYTLVEAYYSGIVTDMDAVYEMIISHDIDYAFTVENVDKSLLELFESKGFTHLHFVHKLGEVNGKQVCFTAGGTATLIVTNFVIGNAVYCSSDGALDLYIVKDDEIYPLENAEEQGIINLEEANEIYEILAKPENKTYTNGIYKFDSEAEQLLKTRFGAEYDFSLLPLCDIGEYKIYCEYRENIFVTNKRKDFGDYKIRYYNFGEPYDLGIYAIKDNEVYTLDEAFENKLITSVKPIYEATHGKSYVIYPFYVKDKEDPYVDNNTQILKNGFEGVDFDIEKLGSFNSTIHLYYNHGAKLTQGGYTRYIDGYEFTINEKQAGYDLGLYVIYSRTNSVRTLEEALGETVTMETVCEMLSQSDIDFTFEIKNSEVFAQDEQRYIQYLKDNGLYVNGPENKDEYAFVNLGEIDGYRFYYGYSEKINGVGYGQIIVGDYEIDTQSSASDFYFINDEEIISCVKYKDIDRALQEKVCTAIDEYLLRYTRVGYRYISGYSSAYPYLNKTFINELNDYIISIGYDDFFFGEDKTLFNQDNIKTSDKIKVLHQEKNFAIIQLVGPEMLFSSEEYTNYTFVSDTYFHESNPCGYFVLTNNWRDEVEMKTLASAINSYKNSAHGEMYYSYYIPHINHKPENIQKVEKFMQQRYGNKFYNMKLLFNEGNAELYYNENRPLYEPIDGYRTTIIGNYEFIQYLGTAYELGLFVVAEDTLYTLEEAYDAEVFTNLDALYEYDENNDEVNFAMIKMEDAKYKMYTHLIQLGVDFQENYYNPIIMDYVNLGTVDGYTVCAGGRLKGYNKTFKIGDYVLVIPKTYEVCTNGLWIADENGIYDLEQAYNDGRINSEQLDEICAVINSHKDYTAERSDETVEAMLGDRFGEFDYTLFKVQGLTNCKVYYNLADSTPCDEYERKMGSYTLTLTSKQEPYDLGLYVCSDDGVYTLEEAWEKQLITADEMYTLFKTIRSRKERYHFSITKGTDDIQINDPYVEMFENTLEAGQVKKLFAVHSANGKKVTFVSENPEVLKVNQKGEVTGLKKGKATIIVTVGDKVFTRQVKVITNPKLEKKTITVKKNKVKKVKLTGKVKGIKNVYVNTKKAEIISKKNTTNLIIKGLKKGTTTLRIKVNGVKTLKIKVKVK